MTQGTIHAIFVFHSVISQWSLFDWYWGKSSAGRNHLTKQGRSSPWAGRGKATTSVSASSSSSSSAWALPLSAFLLGLELLVSHQSNPREHTKVFLFWLYRKSLLRWRVQGGCWSWGVWFEDNKKDAQSRWVSILMWWHQIWNYLLSLMMTRVISMLHVRKKHLSRWSVLLQTW